MNSIAFHREITEKSLKRKFNKNPTLFYYTNKMKFSWQIFFIMSPRLAMILLPWKEALRCEISSLRWEKLSPTFHLFTSFSSPSFVALKPNYADNFFMFVSIPVEMRKEIMVQNFHPSRLKLANWIIFQITERVGSQSLEEKGDKRKR